MTVPRMPLGRGRLSFVEPAARAARGIPTLYRRHIVPRLNAEQKAAFNEIGPAALWVAGNLNGPQARRIGDNLGAWPVEMGLTQRWSGLSEDNQFEGSDPNEPRAVLFRLWCEDYSRADRLQCAAYQAFKAQQLFDPALGDWMNFDAEATLMDISAVILQEASRLGIETWTDDDLVRRLDDLIAMARRYDPPRPAGSA